MLRRDLSFCDAEKVPFLQVNRKSDRVLDTLRAKKSLNIAYLLDLAPRWFISNLSEGKWHFIYFGDILEYSELTLSGFNIFSP